MALAGQLEEPLVLDKAGDTEEHVAAPCAAALPRATAPLGEWVALVAARDETAMRELHRAIVAQVHRVVARIISDPYLADEVVSECFWQVWREAPHFDVTRGSVATWVAMIARSRALDALRRRKVLATHEEPLMDDYEQSLASSEKSPAAHLEMRQRNLCLDTALARIDPMQRQMLVLSFTGGLSHEQVAEHCGMALGTVKSHIRRGLAQMHRHCVRAGLRP